MHATTPTPHQFAIGQRVELHPSEDRWMRGDRYGVVVKLGRRRLGQLTATVKLDRSGSEQVFPETQLTAVS